MNMSNDNVRGQVELSCIECARKEPTNFYFMPDDEIKFMQFLNSISCNDFNNEKKSKFPDFEGENGFIEHFAIYAGKSNRKGSNYESTCGQMQNRGIPYGYIPTDVLALSFESGFKNTWSKHVKSFTEYKKYKSTSDFCVFMLDMRTTAHMVRMYDESLFAEFPYRLSKDSSMLQFIKENSEGLTHIIFIGSQEIETNEKFHLFSKWKLNPFVEIFPISHVDALIKENGTNIIKTMGDICLVH